MDINQLNRAYAEQYFKDHNLKEQYKEAMKQKPSNEKTTETLKQKPLSDEEIIDIWGTETWSHYILEFARAIEERHGIK